MYNTGSTCICVSVSVLLRVFLHTIVTLCGWQKFSWPSGRWHSGIRFSFMASVCGVLASVLVADGLVGVASVLFVPSVTDGLVGVASVLFVPSVGGGVVGVALVLFAPSVGGGLVGVALVLLGLLRSCLFPQLVVL